MRYAYLLIFSLFFYADLHATPRCAEYFRQKPDVFAEMEPLDLSKIIDEAAAVLGEVRVLRAKINFWRNLTGDAGRKALHDLRMNKKHFIFLFRDAQDSTIAIELYRDAFLDVELGWFRLNKLQKEQQDKRSISMSVLEIQEVKRKFAESFADYTFIRGTLERMAEAQLSSAEKNELLNTEEGASKIAIEKAVQISASNARYVLQSLGTPSFVSAENAPLLPRPSIEQIHQFFRANPELLILKLKGDLRLQRKYAIRLVPITLTQVETIQGLVLKLVPERYRSIVGGFIGLNYNSFVLKRYLQEIETVIDTPNVRPMQRLEVLRVISANKNTDEFLTTFARLTLYTKQWVELKKEAEQLKDEPLYDKFYRQILAAEQKAIKADSWLTPFYKPSFIDHVRVWLGPAAAVIAADYFTEALNFSTSILQSLQIGIKSLGL